MPHALSFSTATLAGETEGYLGTWILGYLGTSSSTDVFYMGGMHVLSDKPCLGLACPYRAAGRYATALVPQHHQHNHTTTPQPNSPQTPIPFPLTPNSSISPTFMTLDASAASATIPGPMLSSPMVFFSRFHHGCFCCIVPCRNGCSAPFSQHDNPGQPTPPQPQCLRCDHLRAPSCHASPANFPRGKMNLSPLLHYGR